MALFPLDISGWNPDSVLNYSAAAAGRLCMQTRCGGITTSTHPVRTSRPMNRSYLPAQQLIYTVHTELHCESRDGCVL